MVSDGKIHPPLMGRFWLRYALAGMQSYNFTRVNSMEDILKFDMNVCCGMVLYFHHQKISEAALVAFDEFVTGGGGVLAIHSATASFKDSGRFADILGGKFSGHGPVEPFSITPVSSENEIFGNIPEFQIVDELYLHDLKPDIETHFTTIHNGQLVPMVWTRIHGKGRICFACPGHRAASMRISEYQQILTRGLEWVCNS